MGKTSNQSKQQWNAKNYAQLKVSLKPDTVATFRAACAANNVSMTSAIEQFINQYCGTATKKGGYAPNLSTKRQRRTAVRSAVNLLERIKDNETQYQDNIPDNLRGSDAFDSAEDCISALAEAIELLETAYLYH